MGSVLFLFTTIMKTIVKLLLPVLMTTGLPSFHCAAQDWPNLNCYRNDNQSLWEARHNDPDDASKNWVVFMGDSGTQGWAEKDPDFFTKNNYIGRGINGQTTPQMLLRFRQDVIELAPKAVVILGGANDIAGNTGPSSIDMIMDNIISMVQLAQANHIKVVLCSVLPSNHFYWIPELKPADTIIELNRQIKAYAEANHIPFADYYSVLVDDQKGLNPAYRIDTAHPSLEGYKLIEPLVVKAIGQALSYP